MFFVRFSDSSEGCFTILLLSLFLIIIFTCIDSELPVIFIISIKDLIEKNASTITNYYIGRSFNQPNSNNSILIMQRIDQILMLLSKDYTLAQYWHFFQLDLAHSRSHVYG